MVYRVELVSNTPSPKGMDGEGRGVVGGGRDELQSNNQKCWRALHQKKGTTEKRAIQC